MIIGECTIIRFLDKRISPINYDYFKLEDHDDFKYILN